MRIADTSTGIPADVKEKIYDLYFTTKQHGSGIGLAMTYRDRAAARWYDRLHERAGRGTTFVMRFPVSVISA